MILRFFVSLAGFTGAAFGLYIINGFNRMAENENLYAEQDFYVRDGNCGCIYNDKNR